jgi:hypothetical protein
MAYADGQKSVSEPSNGSAKIFIYKARKFGIPILKATIKIENGSLEQGDSLYQIQASVDSLSHVDFLFRMHNRFTSIIKGETCTPIRYVKEINQEGLLIKNKHYHQISVFDYRNNKMLIERPEMGEKQEIPIAPGTCDPLSMFARYYLKEELHPGQDIGMSIYDGVKLRKMTFHSKEEKVKQNGNGTVEAVCLESTTSFSSFGEREGIIRIWYTTDGKKTPISMELELPIGNIKFELEEEKGS